MVYDREAALAAEHIAGQDALARYGVRACRETLRYAWGHSAYYRESLAEAGLDAGALETVECLDGIPFTTKSALAREGAAFWCVHGERVVDWCTTSGTSGPPVVVPLTGSDIDRLSVNEWLSFACAGVTPSDVVLLAVTQDRCFMAGMAYLRGLQALGASVVRLGAAPPEMCLAFLEQFGPTVVVGVPTYLRRVAACAAERGMDLAGGAVRRLVCVGESVRDGELRGTALCVQLEAAWGARVHGSYGATELASSFCECGEGSGGHVHPGLVCVEVVDEAGRAVPDGSHGELVATTLGIEGMPLIRFRTGDITFVERGVCGCGLATPRVGPVLGRKHDMLKVRGTTVYPAAVSQVLEGLAGVTGHVVVATSGEDGNGDALRVVVCAAEGAAVSGEVVRERLRAALRVAPEVELSDAATVERLRTEGSLRKARSFIDLRERGG